MGFSARTAYGLVALMDLAAAYADGAVVQTREICRCHGIPERYLEQMLTGLRKAGFLSSSRGPRGGFQLTRPPGQISVAEIVDCLEGTQAGEGPGDPQDAAFAVLTALDARLQQARQSLLEATSLAQLLQEREALRQPLPMFYI